MSHACCKLQREGEIGQSWLQSNPPRQRPVAKSNSETTIISPSTRARWSTHLSDGILTRHLLLELLLQLLAFPDALLVAGKIRQLLQPGVREVLWEVLTAPLVGWEQLLRQKMHVWDTLHQAGLSWSWLRNQPLPEFSGASSRNVLAVRPSFLLTIRRLSMPTFLRATATEFRSLSLIHALNSFTANVAETPEKVRSHQY